ncbi:MFS transporter [Nocardioides sp. GY 10113]|uniref:MFS transporter n=1 Tax=Nocardioides sp. GY 10113 TaxID=2569761 RepID=UPI0010A7F139|nr:MFS transporter [Nocardioides sp. GY 10113]TIC88413.1 MFS transporter [Nocardioides sp. GY 10113]
MSGEKAPGRGLFATLAAIATVTAVISSLGAPLVPSIAETYDVPVATAQWALTATLLVAAVATPAVGRWASGRLRRPILLGGLAVVLLGAALSALAVEVEALGIGTLVAGRALQGVGLALVPLTLAVARDEWSGPVLVRRLSWLSVTVVAGAGLGYPLTAFTAQQLGVAGAYWFGAALVAVTLWAAAHQLPRAAAGAPQHVDLVGLLLLSSATVGLLLAISRGEVWGWDAPATIALGAAGVALLPCWALWSVRPRPEDRPPLIDLRLATRPALLGPNTVTICIATAMYGLLTLVVLLVRGDPAEPDAFGLGYGVTAAGLVLVPYSLLSVAGSRLARLVAARLGPHLLLPIGSTAFGASMLLLAGWHDELWQALAAMALGGLGSGFTFSSLPMLIVPHVPAAETGSALGFNQLLRYLGFSFGSAASVALLHLYGGTEAAFEGALVTLGALSLLAAAASVAGNRLPGRGAGH